MSNNKTEWMFKLAVREARKSDCHYRLGAVLVQQRKVLGRACNTFRSHPLTNENTHARMKGLHSEIASCLNAHRSQLEGADIYVARILKNDSLALSKPCDICRSVLTRFGVNRVFYTISPDEYGVIEL
jgi:tRNA(Arg) A34 adenosine deaminase TadA